MSFLRTIPKELREKPLWCVAVVLAVAIIAVPIALSQSSSPAPVAQLPQPTPPPFPAASVPAINVESTPSSSHLTGASHDPFNQGAASTTSTTSTSTTSTSTTSTPPTSTTGSSSPGGSSSTPPSITPPNAKPQPAPTGLTATQSYGVSLAITNSSGGLNTIDSLERLSPLPSKQQPLLVDLGVQQGGKRVMFVVQPGTVVNGPGACTPGPIDCELLSLAPDQTESVSQQTPTGTQQVALFAVISISADNHPSASAADKARRSESAAGRQLLNNSTLAALSLFQYEPSAGAIVDLRNLTVNGGS